MPRGGASVTGKPVSPPRDGVYPLARAKDFYDQEVALGDRLVHAGPPLDAWQYVTKLVPAASRPAAA
jgi:hypothetical protein